MSRDCAGRRILLTGATGFIGSHVARRLVSDGHEVTATIRSGSDRWRIADIESQLEIVVADLSALGLVTDRLRSARPEICIHLAWKGWSGQAEIDANLASLSVSLDMLRLMREISCPRFVAAGTCFEYDITSARLDESTPLTPHNLYGACKKAFFEVAQQFSDQTGVSVATPRIFYLYGPYENARLLVPSITCSLLRGEVAKVTPGDQVRDYLHVEDIAAAICTVAQSGVTGPVNIASGEAVTIGQVAQRIGQLMGKPDMVHLGALEYREGEPMHILGDATMLRRRLGWSPRFDLDSGLQQTIDWWRGQERRV